MSDPAELLNQLKIDRRSPPRRRRWPWVLAALALLAVLAALWLGRRPLQVEVAQARSADSSGPISLLDASGFVTARRIATVSSKITGKVLDVLIEEGQRVTEGDLLARLDPTDAEAQRALAAAQQAAARSQLAEAQAQLVLAEHSLRRQRELAARQLTSAAALDQAQAERDSRQARLNSLRRSVEVAAEQLAVAELGVQNTEVRAPFSGVVIAKAAQPGEMISPISAGGGFTRTGIGTLVDMDSLEVQVDVNEAYIGRVQPQMQVTAVLNAYPDWIIPGSVIAIIPTADRSKATVKVRIALQQRDPRIVPDMGVRVSFLQAADADAAALQGVWVPQRALTRVADKPAVFILLDGQVALRHVTPGPTRDADQLISAGLAPGDTVILSPPDGLRAGRAAVAKAG